LYHCAVSDANSSTNDIVGAPLTTTSSSNTAPCVKQTPRLTT
jgi:hypothetical protein